MITFFCRAPSIYDFVSLKSLMPGKLCSTSRAYAHWQTFSFPHITHLTLSMLGKIFSRRHFEIYFLLFSQKIGFDMLCKLSPPKETICIKCQILFSGNNKKNVFNLSSGEFANRVKS